jgi:S-DNA-T family DNA segregation ATPase FtsK/SpoIIIE
MSRSIRPYLEYQADRVEAVLAAHRAPGRVTGGTVGPRHIRFFLNPAPHIRFSAVKKLADDLALAMRVSTLSINREKEGIVLEFSNPNPGPVSLLSLLDEVRPLPAATALLGLTDDGAPLLARLSAPEVAHILVSGTTGSGKSVLLQALAVSLALSHHPGVLQMLCIDPKGRTFRALDGIPHLTRPVISEPAEAVEGLRSLVKVMELRDRRGEYPETGTGGSVGRGTPRIVVFIDELADLIMQGDRSVEEAITRLAQRGREAGIHLVAATQHPSSAILGSLMRANFPLRLVGRVVSADDARVASGRAGTNAHLLNGRGDFLAVSGGDAPIRFQVAYAREKDLRPHLSTLAGMREYSKV